MYNYMYRARITISQCVHCYLHIQLQYMVNNPLEVKCYYKSLHHRPLGKWFVNDLLLSGNCLIIQKTV